MPGEAAAAAMAANPWLAGAGIAANLIGGVATAPSGPQLSSASNATYGSNISSDNWSVNFHGTQTATPTSIKSDPTTAGMAESLGLSGIGVGGNSRLPLLLAAGLVAVVLLKRKKAQKP